MQEPSISSSWTVCNLIINYPVYLLIIDECIYFPVIFPPPHLTTIFQGIAMECSCYLIMSFPQKFLGLSDYQKIHKHLSSSFLTVFHVTSDLVTLLHATSYSSLLLFSQPQILSRMFGSVEVSPQITCRRLIVLQSNGYRSYLSV